MDWRGAALKRVSRPDRICSMARRAETGEKQAAPENDPAFGCSIGLSDRDTGSKRGAGWFSGAACFHVSRSQHGDRAKYRQVLRRALKRLPSRRAPPDSWLLAPILELLELLVLLLTPPLLVWRCCWWLAPIGGDPAYQWTDCTGDPRAGR